MICYIINNGNLLTIAILCMNDAKSLLLDILTQEESLIFRRDNVVIINR
jgi:hypothetical protein